jgi:hypothetical protein
VTDVLHKVVAVGSRDVSKAQVSRRGSSGSLFTHLYYVARNLSTRMRLLIQVLKLMEIMRNWSQTRFVVD